MSSYFQRVLVGVSVIVAGCGGENLPELCDLDGDGVASLACDGLDCDDTDKLTFPGADELCDNVDHNCDGWVHLDAVNGVVIYDDADGDGYGDPLTEQLACQPSWPQTALGDDCDDSDASLNPATLWFEDSDGDGMGNPDVSLASCEQPDGYVANNQDFDDTDPSIAGCWTDISVGRNHSCAVKTDGSVVCWGSDGDGQVSAPVGNNFVQVSAGYRNTCALDGTTELVSCWGANSAGQSSPPSLKFRTVACGLSNCCGLLVSGTDNVECWGSDTDGLSTPPEGTYLTPSKPFISTVSSGGGFHACGILDTGELECWGSDSPFQGVGQSPTDFPSGTFQDVNAGHYFTCAVHDNGDGTCWGTNGNGEATVPAGSWEMIRAGTVHTCGVKVGGEVSCWGTDTYDRSNAPPDLMSIIDVNQLHSCGIGLDGIVRCWGYNDSGQLDVPSCQ